MSAPEPPLAADALLRALNEHELDYLVIGAFAVAAHGVPRATTDLDIVPNPEEGNLTRLLEALQSIEAKLLPLDIPEHGEELSVEWLAEGGNFAFATRYGQLDVLQSVAELVYEELASQAESASVFGLPVRVCSYRHLVAMKEVADRPQDRLDLERLREARGTTLGGE